jgi:uncharacterized RDD family membrane protein YckC
VRRAAVRGAGGDAGITGADRGISTMSTTPEGDAGRPGGTQGGTHPGAPPQAGVPGQERYGSVPAQSPAPSAGHEQGQAPGQAPGQEPGAGQGGQPDRTATTATMMKPATRVTGRRIVQYLIDSFLVGIIPGLVSIPFDSSNSTFVHALGAIVAFCVFVLVGFLYWAVFTHAQNGQTLGMRLLRVRVISMSGGPASTGQLAIRWLGLILDSIPYTWPFTGLVGYIVILFSRDRQRIGDHLARTLVVAVEMIPGGGEPRPRSG